MSYQPHSPITQLLCFLVGVATTQIEVKRFNSFSSPILVSVNSGKREICLDTKEKGQRAVEKSLWHGSLQWRKFLTSSAFTTNVKWILFAVAYQVAADLTCRGLIKDVDPLARTEHAFSILVHKIQPERPFRLKFYESWLLWIMVGF